MTRPSRFEVLMTADPGNALYGSFRRQLATWVADCRAYGLPLSEINDWVSRSLAGVGAPRQERSFAQWLRLQGF